MITPFTIDVPAQQLDDLAARLARTRWPDELPDAGWDYGIPRRRIEALVDYWRTDYDWRAQETALNAFPQYVTEIDGQRIHFLHLRSGRRDALPLLLSHGWPGTFAEFVPVIELLADDFHLVIPSMPGYPFSGPARKRGWDVARIGGAWVALMRRLGYSRYGVHGGDWGSAISRKVGALAPADVVGVHLSYLPTPPPDPAPPLSDADAARLDQVRRYLRRRPGYQVVHETSPQTLGYGLTDSPVGLLAWIAERFADWTDPSSPISDDHLLTTVMLYWLTGTAASAIRLYRENRKGPLPCPSPMGVAVFRHDITRPVRALAERSYRIVHWSEYDRGGHFPALEVPELLAGDLRTFFGGLR
mgnify:CR=1 FL=1